MREIADQAGLDLQQGEVVLEGEGGRAKAVRSLDPQADQIATGCAMGL
jgi:hypothetical protein